jgi:phosphoribosylformylglycinamidine synthase
MVTFFKTPENKIIALKTTKELSTGEIEKLNWLFDGSVCLGSNAPGGIFVGPRKEMITPWSTNAVEITQNMGILNERIE